MLQYILLSTQVRDTMTTLPPSSINFDNSFTSSSFAKEFIYRLLSFLQDVQILVSVLVAIVVFVSIHSLRQKKLQGLPCWPFLGMLPSLILCVDICEWLSDIIFRQNRTFRFKGPWFSSVNFVLIWEPHNLEHVLKTNFTNFPKGNLYRDTYEDLLGDGIFNADDKNWLRQRKTASIELFHSSKFRDLTTESLIELVHSRLLPFLEYSVEHELPIDLQDVLLRLTFDNVCMIAFGVDPGSLGSDDHGLKEVPFAEAFQDATEASTLRFGRPTCVWKAMRHLDLGTEKRLRKSIEVVDEFAQQVIETRKKELSLSFLHDIKRQKSDLLTVFMGLKDEENDGKPFSDKFLRDICVNFILAGRDTSSVAMSWFFWLLGQNPAAEERIIEEICRILGGREDVKKKKNHGKKCENRTTSVIFRPEEVKKMEYLHAALSESLRLYPSVPVDRKAVLENDVLPDGTVVKKGENVLYSIYSMGRIEAIWGKDCMEYKPERWLRDGRFTSEPAYKFTAFNGGPRLCLGKDFAYYQMKFVVASILYRYHVKVVENHRVVPKATMTLYMKHGLKVNLYRRDESHLPS